MSLNKSPSELIDFRNSLTDAQKRIFDDYRIFDSQNPLPIQKVSAALNPNQVDIFFNLSSYQKSIVMELYDNAFKLDSYSLNDKLLSGLHVFSNFFQMPPTYDIVTKVIGSGNDIRDMQIDTAHRYIELINTGDSSSEAFTKARNEVIYSYVGESVLNILRDAIDDPSPGLNQYIFSLDRQYTLQESSIIIEASSNDSVNLENPTIKSTIVVQDLEEFKLNPPDYLFNYPKISDTDFTVVDTTMEHGIIHVEESQRFLDVEDVNSATVTIISNTPNSVLWLDISMDSLPTDMDDSPAKLTEYSNIRFVDQYGNTYIVRDSGDGTIYHTRNEGRIVTDSIEGENGTVKRTIATKTDGSFVTEDVFIDFNLGDEHFSISNEQIGAVFGSTLGKVLGGDNLFRANISGAIGSKIGGELATLIGGRDLNPLNGNYFDSFQNYVNTKIGDISGDLLTGITNLGANSLSSFLAAEMFDALGSEGTAHGEILQTVTSEILGNSLEILASNPSEFPNVLIDAYSKGGIDIVQSAGETFASATAGIVGRKIGSSLVSIDSENEAIGSSLGATLGSLFTTFSWVGFATGIIGTAIGFIVGETIGRWFGSPDPEATWEFMYDFGEQKYVPSARIALKDNGLDTEIRDAGESISAIIESITESVGGQVIDAPNYFRIGHFHEGLNININSDEDQSWHIHDVIPNSRLSDMPSVIKAASLEFIKGIEISGGDIFIKRAIHNSTASGVDLEVLLADIEVATKFTQYIRTPDLINSLIELNPNSPFTLDWVRTMARAQELGLGELSPVDYTGGLQGYVNGIQHTYQAEFNSIGLSIDDGDLYLYIDDISPINMSFTMDELALSSTEFIPKIASEILDVDVIGNMPDIISTLIEADSGPNGKSIPNIVLGGDVNNDIIGSVNNDLLISFSGQDRIIGGAGDDKIDGGAGADVISGGYGNDILIGGSSDPTEIDVLYGGIGNDTYFVNSISTALDIVNEDGGLHGGDSDVDIIVSEGKYFWDYYDVGEILTISSIAGDGSTFISGKGSSVMNGNDFGNTLLAYGASNVVNPGKGIDSIGLGYYGLDASFNGFNTVNLKPGDDINYIYDFESGIDKVDVSAYSRFSSGAEILDNVVDTGWGSFVWMGVHEGQNEYFALVGLGKENLDMNDFLT